MNTSFLFFCLQHVFAMTTFVGAILFLFWAYRLKQEQLKQIMVWVLGVGIVGMLVFGLLGGASHPYMWGAKGGVFKGGSEMWEYMNGQGGMMNGGVWNGGVWNGERMMDATTDVEE